MTIVSPPWCIQASSHPAATFRRMTQGVMGAPFGSFSGGIQATSGGGHGIVGSTDLAVAQNGTPNMSVNVAGGQCFIRGTQSSHQGVYEAYNDATYNVTISAADATNPRKDLIVVQVRDAEYSGASNDVRIVAVTGTPAASPADPAVPANSLVLARVAVAANATTITNANITDLRTRAYGLGAVAVCTSSLRPSPATEGMMIYETDTDRVYVYNGSQWQPISGGYRANGSAWTASTSYGAITGAAITLPAGSWLVQGKVYFTTSTASARTTYLRLYNQTSSTELDASGGSEGATTGDLSLVVMEQVILTAPAVLRLDAKVSATDGTQLVSTAKIFATPQSVFS